MSKDIPLGMEWPPFSPPFHGVPRDPFSLCAKKIDVAHRLRASRDGGPKTCCDQQFRGFWVLFSLILNRVIAMLC